MKKSPVTIAVLVGVLAINLSLLCNAHCIWSGKVRPRMAVGAEVDGVSDMRAAADLDKAERIGSDRKICSGIGCGGSADIMAPGFDLNHNLAISEPLRYERAAWGITPANPVIACIEPVSLEKPPRLLV